MPTSGVALLAALLAVGASGFVRPPSTLSRVGCVRARRIHALASSDGGESSPPPDGEGRDASLNDSELAAEFEMAMRSKLGLEEIRARERQVLDSVIDNSKQQLDAVKREMDAELEALKERLSKDISSAADEARRDVAAKMDEAERVLRAQADAVRRGEPAGSTVAPAGGGGALGGLGAAAGGGGGARERTGFVVLVGAGGPLMRAVAHQLSRGVRVRAVLAGEGGKGKGDERGLQPWPRQTAGATGSAGAGGAGGTAGGGTAGAQAGGSFELVEASREPAGRFAVQRVVLGASAVLVCLVDGERREWCLDEPSARRWIEGAGGTAQAAGMPALPIPVEKDDARGRLIVVASAQGTNRAGGRPALRAPPAAAAAAAAALAAKPAVRAAPPRAFPLCARRDAVRAAERVGPARRLAQGRAGRAARRKGTPHHRTAALLPLNCAAAAVPPPLRRRSDRRRRTACARE